MEDLANGFVSQVAKGFDKLLLIERGPYRSNAVRLPDQDHRAIKRRTRPMLGFNSFRCARILLGGIEVAHMISKGQMKEVRQ